MLGCSLGLADSLFLPRLSSTAQSRPLCLPSAQGTFRPKRKQRYPGDHLLTTKAPALLLTCAASLGAADWPPGCQPRAFSASVWVSSSLNSSLSPCVEAQGLGVLSGSKLRLWSSGSEAPKDPRTLCLSLHVLWDFTRTPSGNGAEINGQ